MTDTNRDRPKTLEAALRALDEAEAQLRASQATTPASGISTIAYRAARSAFACSPRACRTICCFSIASCAFCSPTTYFSRRAAGRAEIAVGRHISEIVGVERFLERQPNYERALAGQTVSYESTGAAGNEGGFFRFSYRPSFDDAGKVRGIFSMATDISERRKVELELEAKQAELLRSNKDLEQFAYVASHDLKAPLRAIELLVQWITEGLGRLRREQRPGESRAARRRRTQRLNRLLDDLLAYSRAGRKVGAHREADSHALVLDVAQMLNPPPTLLDLGRGPAAEFKTHPAPLEQVLRNLISNAVKHHPGPEGRIVVSCEDQGDATSSPSRTTAKASRCSMRSACSRCSRR